MWDKEVRVSVCVYVLSGDGQSKKMETMVGLCYNSNKHTNRPRDVSRGVLVGMFYPKTKQNTDG